MLNVDTFSVSLIKVETLWLHTKLICKLERIGRSILYVQKRNEHWIPFIYDLRMLWSPVQNFESALGITHAPTRSLSISSRGPKIDWKRTRVGTIRSFRLWTYNILPLIDTDPPPRAGHFYHRNRPNLYLLARHAIDLWTSIDLANMCRGMHEPNGMPKLRRERHAVEAKWNFKWTVCLYACRTNYK